MARGRELADELLVARIRVAVDEADGDRVHSTYDEFVERAGSFLEVEGYPNFASDENPLGHTHAKLSRDERGRLVPDEAVGRPRRATDLEDVLEACRGDQSNRGTASFEQRVHSDGRAMKEAA